MKISKPIEAIPGESWVLVYEYINDTLMLEGIKTHPTDDTTVPTALTQRIRFSRPAIKKMLPLMKEWLKEPTP